MIIGILAIQGAISEHFNITNRALLELNIDGKVILIRNKNHVAKIDALIIPGGESTTISRMMIKTGIYNTILKMIREENLPIMGTCAGSILLAKKILNQDLHYVKPLEVMDMEIERNAFGRQRESFEKDIVIKGLNEPFHAVFIRAPIIRRTWGDCKPISILDKDIIIAAKQDNLLALTFHPELTNDTRLHKYFLKIIK
jgi:5'-phosphate synthase pdxT subunit